MRAFSVFLCRSPLVREKKVRPNWVASRWVSWRWQAFVYLHANVRSFRLNQVCICSRHFPRHATLFPTKPCVTTPYNGGIGDTSPGEIFNNSVWTGLHSRNSGDSRFNAASDCPSSHSVFLEFFQCDNHVVLFSAIWSCAWFILSHSHVITSIIAYVNYSSFQSFIHHSWFLLCSSFARVLLCKQMKTDSGVNDS